MKHKTTQREPGECTTTTAPGVSQTASTESICINGGGTATVTQFPESMAALLERAFALLESQCRLIEALALSARRGRRPRP